jgi:hypothetical protein
MKKLFFIFVASIIFYSCAGLDINSKTTFRVFYKGHTYTCSTEVVKSGKILDIENECARLD